MLNDLFFPRWTELKDAKLGKLQQWSNDAHIPGNKGMKSRLAFLKRCGFGDGLIANLVKRVSSGRIIILNLEGVEGAEFCLSVTLSDNIERVSPRRYVFQKNMKIAYRVEPEDFLIRVIADSQMTLGSVLATNIHYCDDGILENLVLV